MDGYLLRAQADTWECVVPPEPPAPPSPSPPPPSPPVPPTPPPPAVSTTVNCLNKLSYQWLATDQPVNSAYLMDIFAKNPAYMNNVSLDNGVLPLNGTGWAQPYSAIPVGTSDGFHLLLRVTPTRAQQVLYTAMSNDNQAYFNLGINANASAYVEYSTPSHDTPQTYTDLAKLTLNSERLVQLYCGPGLSFCSVSSS
jgi:hypothetical protein